MQKGIHDGHRKRLKEEFAISGFNSDTPPHKILEMLLFYSIPRIDTNELAHELINNFGSLSAVIDAKPQDIMKIKGAGESTATLFKFIRFISNYYVNEKRKDVKKFGSPFEICDYLLDKYIGFDKEVVSVISLDNLGGFLGFDIIGEGDITSVGISLRKIIEVAFKRNAVAIILAHNHPHGEAVPSAADLETTLKIAEALKNINVSLTDHIILSDGDYISFRLSEMYCDIFK